jgi:MFS family permease
MQTSSSNVPQVAGVSASGKTWHCGTLVYTKVGLFLLFSFLLWGYFCNQLMQTVVPSILPLKLKALGAPNIIIGLFVSSIPSILALFMNPYISFKSDRLRSKWGRRIPFILFSMPFLCVSMIFLAFSEDIARMLHNSGCFANLSPAMAAIIVIGVFIVAFQFFDQFIGSVFMYIFNDVVPVSFVGRFMGLMQIIGGAAGFLYNYFIFKYADSHMREIFTGAAILYFIGIGMMCLCVKEGQYPPVTDQEREQSRGLAGFKTYFRETLSHKFYWTKFIYRACSMLTWMAIMPFNIFFYKEMGLTLEYVGKAVAVTSIAGIAAAYFSAIFIDRWNPVRIYAYSGVFAVIFVLSNWVWLFVTLSPEAFFWLHMLGAGLIGAFHGTLTNVASLPFDMRLHPKSRFGQFCSAQAAIWHISTIGGGIAVGLLFDGLKWIFHGSDYVYRFNFAWTSFWLFLAAILICSLYRQWLALGGDKHFHPPAPWAEKGYEEQENAPVVGVQRRWLNYALRLVNLLMLLSILYLIPLTGWLWHIGWISDFKWHLMVIIPISIALYYVWLMVERSIRADVKRCAAGEKTLNGIPHHGVFFLKACALLLLLTVWIGKTIMAVHDGLQGGVMVFGVGNLITNVLVIVAVLVLCRIERGYDQVLDYDGRKELQNSLIAVPDGESK